MHVGILYLSIIIIIQPYESFLVLLWHAILSVQTSLLRCAIEAFLSAPSALFIERLNVWKRITNVWQILSNQESVFRKSHTSSNNIEHDTHATRCEKLKKTPVSTSDNSYTSANKLEIVSFQLQRAITIYSSSDEDLRLGVIIRCYEYEKIYACKHTVKSRDLEVKYIFLYCRKLRPRRNYAVFLYFSGTLSLIVTDIST